MNEKNNSVVGGSTDVTLSNIVEGPTITVMNPVPPNIQFCVRDVEYLRLEEGGKIYVRGELVDDNKEVYAAFREFLLGVGALR